MVHSHYGSCLLLQLLIWTAEQHSFKKPSNILCVLDFAFCVARSDKTPVCIRVDHTPCTAYGITHNYFMITF